MKDKVIATLIKLAVVLIALAVIYWLARWMFAIACVLVAITILVKFCKRL